MLLVVVIGFAAALIGTLGTTALQTARQQTTATALAQAKEALIGYAVIYGDTHAGQVHGYLPCPDIDGSNGEGSAKLSCGSKDISSLGRLPWKMLELPMLRDGDGECLWYAVSGTYKNNPKTSMMNWDNDGLFAILDTGGASIAQDVVAVIFAPGASLGGQDRTPDGSAPACGGNYNAGNYLDSDGVIDNAAVSGTAQAISQFRAGTAGRYNDQIMVVTKNDIFNAIMHRADFVDPSRNPLLLMARKAAECIADYGRRNSGGTGDKRLPWAGMLPGGSTDYRTNSNYDDAGGLLAGRLPFLVNASDAATHNAIGSPFYQLAGNGGNCPGVTDWPVYYPWWANWKDHLFYALARDFNPDSGTSSCGTCLSVNGAGAYAAVLVFAGQKLAGQTRATAGDHLDFGNYLESRNLSNGANLSGNSNYESAAASGSFNDVLFCINPDLGVTPC